MRKWRYWRYLLREWLKDAWMKTVGMRLALWLDKRHPDWCWASLCVDIGMGWDLRDWTDGAKNSESCKQDCEKMGTCWCGKMRTADPEATWKQYQESLARPKLDAE